MTTSPQRSDRRGALVGGYLALSVIISICAAVALRDRGGAARWFFGPFCLMSGIGVLLLAWKDDLGKNAFLGAAAFLVASAVSIALGWEGLDMLLFTASLVVVGRSLWKARASSRAARRARARDEVNGG